MSNFYAVRSGRIPGIYHSWDACLQQVQRFSGAIYRKFSEFNEAENFLTSSGVQLAQLPLGRLSTNNKYLQDIQPITNIAPSASSSTCTIPYCTCKLIAVKKSVMKNNRNNGREFFSCPKYLNKCDYFAWADRPLVQASTEITEYSNNDLYSAMKRDTIVIYVDGGCDGNNNVKVTVCPAGWGVVVLLVRKNSTEAEAQVLTELYGPVVLDEHDPCFLGATVGSNNTAELSALGEAMLWLRDHCAGVLNQLGLGEVIIDVQVRFDSEYAAKSLIGLFNGPKNRELIKTVRDAYRDVLQSTVSTTTAGTASDLSCSVSSRFRLALSHVKGHSNNLWNDRADSLANIGKSGKSCNFGRYQFPSSSSTSPAPASTVLALAPEPISNVTPLSRNCVMIRPPNASNEAIIALDESDTDSNTEIVVTPIELCSINKKITVVNTNSKSKPKAKSKSKVDCKTIPASSAIGDEVIEISDSDSSHLDGVFMSPTKSTSSLKTRKRTVADLNESHTEKDDDFFPTGIQSSNGTLDQGSSVHGKLLTRLIKGRNRKKTSANVDKDDIEKSK